MKVTIGDKVTVYGKNWVVTNITDASTVENVIPEIGAKMKELKLIFLSLEAESTKAVNFDVAHAHAHAQHKTTSAFIDEEGFFHDPDKIVK